MHNTEQKDQNQQWKPCPRLGHPMPRKRESTKGSTMLEISFLYIPVSFRVVLHEGKLPSREGETRLEELFLLSSG